jgi:hypothetical protein
MNKETSSRIPEYRQDQLTADIKKTPKSVKKVNSNTGRENTNKRQGHNQIRSSNHTQYIKDIKEIITLKP